MDLDTLIDEVAKSCWTRTTQTEIAFGGSPGLHGAASDVEMIIDYRIPKAKRFMVDVGGLKRILFNLIGASAALCR